MNDLSLSPSLLAAPSTNVFACCTQLSEYEEKYAYSVKVSSGVISAGICRSKQSSHNRRCSGYVGSGRSSSSAARNDSHGGVAPRSKTLTRRTESHSRHRISVRPPPRDDRLKCLGDDQDVADHGPVVDIGEVEPNGPVPWQVRSSAYLPQPRHTGFDEQAPLHI